MSSLVVSFMSFVVSFMSFVVLIYFMLYHQLKITIHTMHHVYNACLATDTVSSELAANPKLPPGDVVKKLYDSRNGAHKAVSGNPTPGDLQSAYECGKWGSTRPSDLYLRVGCHAFS